MLNYKKVTTTNMAMATGIAAHSGGGGVGSCTQLGSEPLSRLDTVAALHDSVCLPACIVGFVKTIVNAGTHGPDVYPLTGGDIYATNGTVDTGTNTPITMGVSGGAGNPSIELFACVDGTHWISTP